MFNVEEGVRRDSRSNDKDTAKVDISKRPGTCPGTRPTGLHSLFPYILTNEDGGIPIKDHSQGGTILKQTHAAAPRRSFLSGVRILSGKIVNNETFSNSIVALIIINSIMMGIGTFDFVTENPAVDIVFENIDQAFLVTFTVELVMQFLYHGFALFKSGWLTFDFLVVILSWAFASMKIIRAFRIVRALRIITRVEGLRDLVQALINVLPRMFAIGMLLLLVFYIFAVMFTQLFKSVYQDGYTSEDYFSRLDITSLTLFQIMTLDSWSLITKELMEVYTWAWFPMITFVMISSFIVINLIIAVICDAIAELHSGDSEETSSEQYCRSGKQMSWHEQNEEVMRLERKIDGLTMLVEQLVQSQQQTGL